MRPALAATIRPWILVASTTFCLQAGAFCFLADGVHAQDFEGCDTPDTAINDDAANVNSLLFDEDRDVIDTEVSVDISHTWIGDLVIDIESPAGTSVRLHNENGDFAEDIELTWSDSGVVNGSESFTCECKMRPSGPGKMDDFTGESAEGNWTFTVTDVEAIDNGTLNEWCLRLWLTEAERSFLRGDVDADGTTSALADALFLIDWQFLGGAPPPCVDAADVNDDGVVLPVHDAIYLLRWHFIGGATPPSPGPTTCNPDPSGDELHCFGGVTCD